MSLHSGASFPAVPVAECMHACTGRPGSVYKAHFWNKNLRLSSPECTHSLDENKVRQAINWFEAKIGADLDSDGDVGKLGLVEHTHVLERFQRCLYDASDTCKWEDWKWMFKALDTSGDGHLSFDELLHAMRVKFRVSESLMSDDVVRSIMNSLDDNKSGTIDLHELINFAKSDIAHVIVIACRSRFRRCICGIGSLAI